MTFTARGRSAVSACNGATVAFSVPFQFQAGGLYVYLIEADTDLAAAAMGPDDGTLLTEGTHYTVAGDGDAGTAEVTTIATYVDGQYVLRWRQTSMDQVASYVPGAFPTVPTQLTLDRSAMVAEEIADDTDRMTARALLAPAGEAGGTLPADADLRGNFLAKDADGNWIASSGTGADDGLRTDLAAGTGALLIGLLSLGVGAVVRSLLAWWRDQPLTAESFGAVGDGVTNDAPAFDKLITAALLTGLPIRLKAGTTYAIGSTGWTGFSYNLSGDVVVIDGNSATLKLLVQPSQQINVPMAITKKVIFRFNGDVTARGKVTIERLFVDLNGFESAAVAFDRIDITMFAHNRIWGAINIAPSVGGYANAVMVRSTGKFFFNYVRNGFHAFYFGHTDDNCYSYNGHFYGNDMGDHVGDGIGGTMQDTVIESNRVNVCYSGYVLAGFGTNLNAQSRNVKVVNNTAIGFATAGVQTDHIKGTGANAYRVKNVVIEGNTLTATSAGKTGIAADLILNAKIANNEIEADYGIVLTGAEYVACSNNQGTGSTGNSEYAGVTTGAGAVDSAIFSTAITLSGNRFSGYTTGIRVLGGVEVNVLHNFTLGGTWGIYFDPTASGRCESNTGSGASLNDIEVRSLNCTFRGNIYTKVYQTRFPLAVSSNTITLGRWDDYQLFEGSAVNITSIAGGQLGQRAMFYCSTANQTFKNAAGIIPKGGADTTPSANGFVSFMQTSAGLWLETGRSY